jgi:hypothetical protein
VPPELEVADVGAAASVRAAVGASVLGSGDGEGAVVADAVGDAVVVVGVVGAVGAGVVAFVALPPDDPAAHVLVGRLAVVRDALVVLGAGRGLDGGRIAGGLPAPNAHPSTVPLFAPYVTAPCVL